MTRVDDWRDNSRDIIHFLLHYLPSSSSSSALPTHLPRLSGSVAAERRMHGFSTRTIVGVGHSLGGCTMLVLCLVLWPSAEILTPIFALQNSRRARRASALLVAYPRRPHHQTVSYQRACDTSELIRADGGGNPASGPLAFSVRTALVIPISHRRGAHTHDDFLDKAKMPARSSSPRPSSAHGIPPSSLFTSSAGCATIQTAASG